MKISDCLIKLGEDTDKIWHHRYGDAYDQLFAGFDRNAPLNILEVGTQRGGTLLAWKEYFPNANVIGVDIVDVVPEKYRVDTVTRVISDIKKYETDTEFDIIIDDGSHVQSDVLTSFDTLFPKLKDGGIYFVEDLHTAYWDSFGGGRGKNTFISRTKELIDHINGWHNKSITDYTKSIKGMYITDSIVIIEKATIEKPYDILNGTKQVY